MLSKGDLFLQDNTPADKLLVTIQTISDVEFKLLEYFPNS